MGGGGMLGMEWRGEGGICDNLSSKRAGVE